MAESRDLRDTLDPPFLRRQQWAQRGLWVAMVAIMAASAMGYFGTSPRATEVVRVEDGGATYELEKPRFTRFEHAERMHLRVHAPGAQGEELKVSFSPAFVANFAVTGVTPQADGGGAGEHGGTYSFRIDDWSRPIVLAFAYEPRKALHASGEMTVEAGDRPAVTMTAAQFVYP